MPSLFIEDAPESKRQRLNDSFIKHEEEDGTDDGSIGTSPPLFDAASAQLIKLTSDQIQLMKYPVGCSVWYDIQPGTQDMKVKVGVVESISVDVTTRNVLYEIISSVNSKGTNDKMFYLEDQLCYASKCLVHVVQHDKCMEGEVIACNTCWADQSLKKTYMVSLFLEENQISILPSVDEDSIKFCLAVGCSTDQSGLPVGGNNESRMEGPAMAKGNSYDHTKPIKTIQSAKAKSSSLKISCETSSSNVNGGQKKRPVYTSSYGYCNHYTQTPSQQQPHFYSAPAVGHGYQAAPPSHGAPPTHQHGAPVRYHHAGYQPITAPPIYHHIADYHATPLLYNADYYRAAPPQPATRASIVHTPGANTSNSMPSPPPPPCSTYYICKSAPITIPPGTLGLHVVINNKGCDEHIVAVISSVMEKCPFQKWVQKGDAIIAINDERVQTLEDLKVGSDKERTIIIAKAEYNIKSPSKAPSATDEWRIEAKRLLQQMPLKCYPTGSKGFNGPATRGELKNFLEKHQFYDKQSDVYDDLRKSGFWFIEFDKTVQMWKLVGKTQSLKTIMSRIASSKARMKQSSQHEKDQTPSQGNTPDEHPAVISSAKQFWARLYIQ